MIPASRPQQSRAVLEPVLRARGLDPARDLIVVGVRGYYRDTMGAKGRNDRRIYDDALFLIGPGHFSAYNANVDPAGYRKGHGTGSAKGMASLQPGVWPVYQYGIHRAGTPRAHMALRQAGGPVTVKRDGAPDYLDTGSFWINIHRGGVNSTSSEGCQTIPPAQWQGFIDAHQREAARIHGNGYRARTYTYVLLEEEDLRIAAAAPVAPAPGLVEVAIAALAVAVASIPAPTPGASRYGADGFLTPATFIGGYIRDHEGALSLHPADNGNWYDPARYRSGQRQRRDKGVLVGSKFGVTAYALAAYRVRQGMPLAEALRITPATMAALDFETARDLGLELYFRAPGFDRLPWNRVTMSIVDKGWGSGPGTAASLLQGMIGASRDGKVGQATAAAYAASLDINGEDNLARRWAAVREAFDLSLTDDGPNDPDKAFLKGWNNRTRSFLPGSSWWAEAKR